MANLYLMKIGAYLNAYDYSFASSIFRRVELNLAAIPLPGK